ncbi:MAG: PEP-CTERM sorting domain-containing protein [Phycisphaerae bacterium]
MRPSFLAIVGSTLVLLAWGALPCQGDVISDDLSEGYALLSGCVDFDAPTWGARVDYAVYAPNQYPGEHEDKSDSYIYAYQIFNDATSEVPLSSFSVGLDAGSGAANPGDDGSYGVAGGEAPLLAYLVGDPPSSVSWAGFDTSPEEYSTVLLYSSPYGYQWKSATLADGGEGVTKQLPSPVPEPLTTSLLAAGGMLALLSRRRRR